MLLANRVAIVTGAPRGIGNAVLRGFAREGASVVLNYIEWEAEAQRTVQEIEAAGGRAMAYRADVTNFTQIQAMDQATVKRFGKVDIPVNNGGYYPRSPWYEI